MAINVTAKQSYVALPLTSDDLPEVLNQVANANDPSEFATAREQIAEAYGSYGIPLPVQQALNTKEKAFNDAALQERAVPAGFQPKPTSEVIFGNLLKFVTAQARGAEGTQTDINQLINTLWDAKSLTADQRVRVKDALITAFGDQGVPNQVQQYLRTQWNGEF